MDIKDAINQVKNDTKGYSAPGALEYLKDCENDLIKAKQIIAIMENGCWEEAIAKHIC